MLKFLLILAIFLPESGVNRAMVVVYPTALACEEAREKVMKEIPSDVRVWYYLECVEGTPTNGTRI